MRMHFLSALVFVCIAAGSVMPDEVLTTVSFDTWGLMSAGKAAYLDYHYATTTLFWAEVTLIDLKTKAKTVAVPSGTGAAYPYYIDYGYFGNNLAWIPFDVGGGGGPGGYGGGRTAYLYYKNLSTGASKQLITSTAWKHMVWVGGDIVAWVDYRNWDSTTVDSVNSEIYLYNLATSQERRVTSDHAYQEKPFTDGQRIVWIDYSAAYGKLFQYTISSSATAEVAPYAAGKNNPRIYGNAIVWEDYRNAGTDKKNVDIYMCDVSTGTARPVCTAARFQGNPFVSGDRIVWEDYRNATASDSTNSDIYGYSISAGTETVLVSGAGYQGHPTLLGDTLCWIDYSSGTMKLMTKVIAATGTVVDTRKPGRQSMRVSGSGNGHLFIYNAVPAQKLEVSVMDMNGRSIAGTNVLTSISGEAEIVPDAGWTNGMYVVAVHSQTGGTITRTCLFTRGPSGRYK
jgi:beta propeller repeat protein